MCFSAPASFTASAVLGVIGVASLKSARQRRERLFAAIPLLFAIQQFIEGFVWLSFSPGAPPGLNAVMTHAYALFSHVLWPTFVPLSVLLIEPSPVRRKVLRGFVGLGLVVSAFTLYSTSVLGITSCVAGQHIEYVSSHFLARTSTALYVLATAISMFFSSHRLVRLFGVVALASFGVVWAVAEQWLISVWCFAAAWLSAIVWVHVKSG